MRYFEVFIFITSDYNNHYVLYIFTDHPFDNIDIYFIMSYYKNVVNKDSRMS